MRNQKTRLMADLNFERFVVGQSNQRAHAAAMQVGKSLGQVKSPLLLYGGEGLGKTHLMHAAGHAMLAHGPTANVVCLHSERFVSGMITALHNNALHEFRRFYRSVDALLIDDIQFFSGREPAQDTFLHIVDTLLEAGRQVILTCDRDPAEIEVFGERLMSRLSLECAVMIELPEVETRVEILMKKAQALDVHLPREVAFFLAHRIRSNVREILGALIKVAAAAKLTGKHITIEFAEEWLANVLAVQDWSDDPRLMI